MQQQMLVSYGGASVNNTMSLLHFNGPNLSTTITDESGKTWTAGGNAKLDTSQSVFGASSLLLDGTGDYVLTADSADFSILGDFTIECWIRRTTLGRDSIYSKYVNASSGVLFDVGASDELRFIMGTGSFLILTSSPTTVPINTWVHVAAVRDGSTMRLFLGGVEVGTLAVTGTPANSVVSSQIGRDSTDNTRDFTGNIDEFRFSRVARYTSGFTPSGPFSYPG